MICFQTIRRIASFCLNGACRSELIAGMNHHDGCVAVEGMGVKSPWKELMEESTSFSRRKSLTSQDEEELESSTSSEDDSERISSWGIPGRRELGRKEILPPPFLFPSSHPSRLTPENKIPLQSNSSNSTIESLSHSRAPARCLQTPTNVIVQRAVGDGKDPSTAACPAHTGLTRAGVSTTDTERNTPTPPSNGDGVIMTRGDFHGRGGEKSFKLEESQCFLPSNSSRGGRSSTRRSKARQRRKSALIEEGMTSDSGEDAALDTALGDSLLLESLVEWVNPGFFFEASSGGPSPDDAVGGHSVSSALKDSGSSSNNNNNPKSHGAVMPKIRREFSGDEDRESREQQLEDTSSPPPNRKSRSRSSNFPLRRTSTKTRETGLPHRLCLEPENQSSTGWFPSSQVFDKVIAKSSTIPGVITDLLSQSILPLFSGALSNSAFEKQQKEIFFPEQKPYRVRRADRNC